MTHLASVTDLEPGALLGEYRIEAVAGRGGMGVVYRAVQEPLGRRVALKVIVPALASDDAFRNRFVRESALAGAIDHPNVVPVYGAGEVDGRLFMAMRWVEGQDLRALVTDHGRLEAALGVEVVAGVAAALGAAHRRFLVHRDVKPANVLVGEHVYLGDFGLTRQITSEGAGALTKTGQLVGTVEYVAPEQVLGEPATPATDIYGLGCVLFFALTGRPPFDAKSEYETMTAHLSEPPPRVTEHVTSAPAALDAVVARALAKDPADRFASADDLAVAARGALTSSAVHAVRAPAPRRSRRLRATAAAPAPAPTPPAVARGRRKRAVVLAVGVIAVLAAGGGGIVAASGGDDTAGGAHGRAANGAHSAARTRVAAPVASVTVGRGPEGVAVDDGVVWVGNARDDTLARIDPARNEVAGEPLEVGDDPDGVAAGSGIVWVASSGDGTLQRVDARSGAAVPGAAEPLGRGAEGVSLGKQLAWAVSSGQDAVVRFDRATGQRVGAPVGVGDLPVGVFVGANSVWVTNNRDGSVTRIDAATSEILGSTRVGRGPRGVVEAAGSVWVANAADGTVSRLDARTGRPAGPPIPVGRNPRELTFGAGSIWVANTDDSTVSRIDARTGRLIGQPIPVGAEPLGLAFGAGAVWVANHGDGTVTRIRV
jgi:DNA-binding beta-propeller fold protein YncE